MTSPARSYLNTSFTEMASGRQREGRPTVMLHADDAARLGIADGEKVVLGNARGEVVLHARIAKGMQPGVLVSESIWPSEAFEGGIGINALTSDDPAPPLGRRGVPRYGGVAARRWRRNWRWRPSRPRDGMPGGSTTIALRQ